MLLHDLQDGLRSGSAFITVQELESFFRGSVDPFFPICHFTSPENFHIILPETPKLPDLFSG
jgi:hypothetical protein